LPRRPSLSVACSASGNDLGRRYENPVQSSGISPKVASISGSS
jgi:hypothetical protein